MCDKIKPTTKYSVMLCDKELGIWDQYDTNWWIKARLCEFGWSVREWWRVATLRGYEIKRVWIITQAGDAAY